MIGNGKGNVISIENKRAPLETLQVPLLLKLCGLRFACRASGTVEPLLFDILLTINPLFNALLHLATLCFFRRICLFACLFTSLSPPPSCGCVLQFQLQSASFESRKIESNSCCKKRGPTQGFAVHLIQVERNFNDLDVKQGCPVVSLFSPQPRKLAPFARFPFVLIQVLWSFCHGLLNLRLRSELQLLKLHGFPFCPSTAVTCDLRLASFALFFLSLT